MQRVTPVSKLLIATATLFMVSCGDNSTGTEPAPEPTTGTLEVTTNTSGDDLDQDGYKFTLGNNGKDLSSNETISISGLDEGSYDAELSNIAGNCIVNGDNPRTITVTAGETATTTFEINCQKIEPVPKQEALDAVKQVMQDKGWSFAKLTKTNSGPSTESRNPSLLDYLATDVSDSGTRQVYLLIGPDGHLIPDEAWQESNKYRCQNQNLRYMKVPVKRFNLKLFGLADGYNVFAQYIDIKTGEIEAQREGQSSSLIDAISSAWNKIQKPIKKPGSPCGEKINNISLQFSSSTTHDLYHKDAGFTDTFTEEVQATVELTYNAEDSMYVGSGDLSWVQFDRSFANCDIPDDATAKVHKFVYDDPNNIELQIQFFNWKRASCSSPNIGDFQGVPDFSLSWWALHENEVHKKHELDKHAITVEHTYALDDLNAVLLNEQIIAFKKYDQGTTKEDDDQKDTFVEETTIEIRRQSDSNK